jgi:hypothetical protein
MGGALLVASSFALGSMVAPAAASADPQYSVMNAPEGVYWRSEPNWAAAEKTTGFGVYDGEIVEVHCYQSGTAVEGSADTMWEYASDVTGPGYGSGWLNEHFINDQRQLDEPSPGVGPCQGAPVAPSGGSPPPPSGSPAVPPPAAPAPPAAPRPTCYGDYCSGKNPNKTNCAYGSSVITEIPRGPEDDFALELLWSPTCKTKWARAFVPKGTWVPARLGAEQSTGYLQEASIGGHYSKTTEVVTPMIYSPSKCVRAFYLPGLGYKWNLVQTACK